MQSIFTTFAFVVSPVISLRRLAIAVVSSMMLLAMNPVLYTYRWSLDFLRSGLTWAVAAQAMSANRSCETMGRFDEPSGGGTATFALL